MDRRYLFEFSLFFFFQAEDGIRDLTVTGVQTCALPISLIRITGVGFPHSGTSGSKRVCRSPKLIAACCALHRLMTPRHPSSAVTGLCKQIGRASCRERD